MRDGAACRGDRTGLLLINLGTPNSPPPENVLPYLDEFLSDPRELGMRAVKSFRESGGEVLTLVPAVNASDAWADAVVALSREASECHPSPGVAHYA